MCLKSLDSNTWPVYPLPTGLRDPLPLGPLGLQPSPRRPQECFSLPTSFITGYPVPKGSQTEGEVGAGRDNDALCRPQQHHPSSSPGTVILSAEALAARRAKQAQRRARQVPAQLSKEQEELVRTLLGAHSRHVGTMFNQFVQFSVSLCMDFGLKEGTRGG